MGNRARRGGDRDRTSVTIKMILKIEKRDSQKKRRKREGKEREERMTAGREVAIR